MDAKEAAKNAKKFELSHDGVFNETLGIRRNIESRLRDNLAQLVHDDDTLLLARTLLNCMDRLQLVIEEKSST